MNALLWLCLFVVFAAGFVCGVVYADETRALSNEPASSRDAAWLEARCNRLEREIGEVIQSLARTLRGRT